VISRARGNFVRFGALAALLWTIPAAAANQAPIANAGPDRTGVAGGTITFDGSASRDPDGTVAAYYWQFGDGGSVTVGTATVGHVYTVAGTYNATLYVRDAAGTWSAAADVAKAVVGTGTSQTTTTIVTTTTSPVTTTTLSTTNKAPTADAGPNQATQTLVTLTFNGSASRDPDGTIAMANWMFGDGTSAAGLTTTHAYAHAGTYTATLQVLDNKGALASDTATITVANRTPIANAGADVSGSTTAAVNLYGGGSSDPDGSITTYAWTFGDGTSGSGMAIAHTYAAAGTYTATLRVTDDKGASASDTAVATIVVTSGNPPTTTWAKKIGSTDSDGAYAVCTDIAGNAFVVGNFRGRVDLGGATLQSAGAADGFIVKYSPTGAILWSRAVGGSSDDTVEGCAVDGAGDVVVAGRLTGTANFGGGNLVANGTSDMAVAKYAGATGAHVWSKRFGGAYDDTASAVAVDGAGSVYFTGYFRGTVDFGGGPLSVPYTSDLDTFVAKLTSAGQYAWAKTFTNTGNERGYGIAVDSTGSVAITGSFSNAMSFGGATLTALNAMTDGFIARFTSSGAHMWSRRFGADDGNEGGYGITIDPSGNVVVTGAAVKACDFGGGLLSALGGSDAFVAKYSASSGAHMWSRRLGGLGNDYGYGVAVDGKSNVYVIGANGGLASFGGSSLTPLGPSDAFVAEYGPTGTLLSARELGGIDADTGRGVALSGANPVTVGYFYASGSFAGTPLSSSGMADGFVARIAP
jgi:PKD repeat protein